MYTLNEKSIYTRDNMIKSMKACFESSYFYNNEHNNILAQLIINIKHLSDICGFSIETNYTKTSSQVNKVLFDIRAKDLYTTM